VGETATASHFSLNGYERQTTPGLEERGVINYPDVHSCGTSTAVSVPCMFSARSRDAFSRSAADSEENLLDVLQRCGVQVRWRENNSGCKGVCDRVPVEWGYQLTDKPSLLSEDGVYDGALLEGLPDLIDQGNGDLLVVLHQLGSHGPAYAKRAPDDAKRFLPECSQADLQNCAQEEMINAYDNTIVYTDMVLSQLIDLLEPVAADARVAMLYVSDHGESLGENGVYLHGYPCWLAPDEQTHVPMVLWLGPDSAQGLGLDMSLVEAGRHQPLSHDNLFHTLLGLFDIVTETYVQELDLLAPARVFK